MSNDNGIYNREEFIKKILEALNLITVTGAKNALLLSSAFQMVNALGKGIEDEIAAKNAVIESLKEQLKRATELQQDDPGGDTIGGQHYDYHFGGVKHD